MLCALLDRTEKKISGKCTSYIEVCSDTTVPFALRVSVFSNISSSK
jgi:hypothetical protein